RLRSRREGLRRSRLSTRGRTRRLSGRTAGRGPDLSPPPARDQSLHLAGRFCLRRQNANLEERLQSPLLEPRPNDLLGSIGLVGRRTRSVSSVISIDTVQNGQETVPGGIVSGGRRRGPASPLFPRTCAASPGRIRRRLACRGFAPRDHIDL